MKMARCDDHHWYMSLKIVLLLLLFAQVLDVTAKRSQDSLTACQHLRRAESRRAKALSNNGTRIRIPKCTKLGEFESVQCMNETAGTDCWCVDRYGVEVPGTRNENRGTVRCNEPSNCSQSSCRMFCPSGFARDASSGCSVCKCRDPCNGIECPRGQSCQQQEVKCKTEPCPPVPTCKKARSLNNWCPAGQPLSIDGSIRPFLCGNEPGKPTCPPLYQCLVENGNDYGVCCPTSLQYKKPGSCPNPEIAIHTPSTGYICGTQCTYDLECQNNEKCCFTKGCQRNCQQPVNVTACHQARALSEILSVGEREGRGYVPDCSGPGGVFSSKQCSRNGLVCWCVDPKTGHKIKGTMGAANAVDCDGIENTIARSLGRSFTVDQCDTNICAAICEYGFKTDHNGCPTCECAEPCEGFLCPMGSHCEVATDPLCTSGSALCSSWPICKPDMAYSNPCEVGTPLTDNITGEVFYCFEEQRESRSFISFFDEEPKEGRAMSNRITCPAKYICTKLHKESRKVCCPEPAIEESPNVPSQQGKQQTMCEYLRDFSDRMEGTEEGMLLAIASPKCTVDGGYESRQCTFKRMKMTRGEHRKLLEEKTIRQMKMLLEGNRGKRDTANLKLYRIDQDLPNVRVAAPSMGRSAKVIDTGHNAKQDFTELFETDIKRIGSVNKRPQAEEEEVEVEIEECWCVDGFGTEIPSSRGHNVTTETCDRLKESIDCLDITCRMGCDYGFTLDPITKCPACSCRDPCDGVTCNDGKECRTVDVSCDDEYCPPVPACLPRKAGQCPFLVPPGSDNYDSNTCDYECRTDTHCDGTKRCCSNGCGTQCVEPQLKTACQHLQAIQMHQASELGIPARKMYVAQCDGESGKWNQIQCGPDNCWCVDDQGQEISGTRSESKTPSCEVNAEIICPLQKCAPCDGGYKVDSQGCMTCECRNLCDEISCSAGEDCQLITVECIDQPCPKMPICVPKRESVCPEGSPLLAGENVIACGPQNEHEACPTTHTCQLNPVSQHGVCCAKTRDVCFESLDLNCLANRSNLVNTTKWRFSPKPNKCVPVVVGADQGFTCHSKNLFHSEAACKSVCPVLTPCERLKLKNSLAAKRSGESSVWFQPRCDPITGFWSPVQCLGKQPSENDIKSLETGRGFSQFSPEAKGQYGVCWCADKKGAPLKGTLTRDLEPVCNNRQARRRMLDGDVSEDPLMEELIRQMTLYVDVDGNLVDDSISNIDNSFVDRLAVTEKNLQMANNVIDSNPNVESTKRLPRTTTRCLALSNTASFPVACDNNGAFLPTQCNVDQCWCVDAAGNQLPLTDTFPRGSRKCVYTPIDSVSIELHLKNESKQTLINLYDILKDELRTLLGNSVENLRVQEMMDGNVVVRFELHDDAKIDTAFAIEEMVKQRKILLGNGHLRPDITLSKFMHRSNQLPIAEAAMSAENTLQTVVFILATASAFLVSIFVVFIMLKRGKKKTVNAYHENKIIGNGDKYIDYGAPIFVLSTNEKEKPKKGEVNSRCSET